MGDIFRIFQDTFTFVERKERKTGSLQLENSIGKIDPMQLVCCVNGKLKIEVLPATGALLITISIGLIPVLV